MIRASWMCAVLAALVLVCGCESSSSSSSGSGGSGGDAIDINSIAWLGDSYAGASRSATLNGASMSGDTLSVSYEPYSWPRATIKVSVDAICCIFYERNGQIVGGKYDYWRTGGQSSKSLHNLKERYQGHSFPAAGARVWTMNASINGAQRSNIIEVSR